MFLRLLIVAAALPLALPFAASAQTAPAPTAAPTAAPTTAAKFSIDTPVQDLYADPAAKVVMDKHLPGLTALPQYDMIKAISLRQLQPYSDGKLTDQLLAAVDADLANIK
jgi:hypothetical protein